MARRISTRGLADPGKATAAWRRWLIVVRLFVLIAGGYAASSALVAGAVPALVRAGLERSEAVVLASMCGIGFYLALLIWGFSQMQLTRLALGLTFAGGAGLLLGTVMRA